MTIGIAILGTFVKRCLIISGTHKLFLILFGIRNMLGIVPDIAQSTHGIRNIFADIRNVPTRPHMVLGMFLIIRVLLTFTLAIVRQDFQIEEIFRF